MESGWETLEHTADIGVRAQAPDIARLFENVAAGMLEIAFDCSAVAEREQKSIAAEATDCEALLVNFLDELVWLVDGQGWLPARVQVNEISQKRVSAVAIGEPRDPARHPMRTIVKGVTFHLLSVHQTPGGWEAEVYFDI